MTYPIPASPAQLVAAQVNSDGIPDLATVNQPTNSVTVSLGDGLGGFGTPAAFAAGSEPGSISAGDLNGDGLADLVVTNFSAKAFNVLLADPDGSMQTAVQFATGTSVKPGLSPTMSAIGDLDGNGDQDLVIAGPGSTAEVWLGDGAGGFTFQSSPAAMPANATQIAVGDVTDDGNADVVAVLSTGFVAVLDGDGTGVLNAALQYPTGAGSVALALGDLNDDSRLDVITADEAANTASVLLGQASGSLGAAVAYPTGSGPVSVAVGDFTDDGKLDVVAAAFTSAQLSVLPGAGNGVLGAATNVALTPAPGGVAVADFNRDGFPDLGDAMPGSGLVAVLLNTAAPVLSGLDPATGSTEGGTAITITGRGFAPGSTVEVAGQLATGVTVVDGLLITATTPAGPAGPVDVAVVRPDGKRGALPGGFVFVAPAPTIANLEPTSGSTAGGTAVTIIGTGFEPAATVTFGGVPAIVTNRTGSTQLVVSTPALGPGPADVVVGNPDGKLATAPGAFTFLTPPPGPIGTVTPTAPAAPSPSVTQPTNVLTVAVTGRTARVRVTAFTPGQLWRLKLQQRVRIKVRAGAARLAASSTKWQWRTVRIKRTRTGVATFSRLPAGLLRVRAAAQNNYPATSSVTFRADQGSPACRGSDCD